MAPPAFPHRATRLALPANGSDLRDGQSWTLAQAVKNDALYALVQGALLACRLFRPRVLRAAGRGVGRFAHVLLRGARRTALANVARAMPHLDDDARRRLVARVFVHLGELLGDAVAMLGDPGFEPERLRYDTADRHVLEEARALGRGVIFASAHLGPWERVAATLALHGVPLTTIAREAYDPRLTVLYDRIRLSRGVRAIYRGRPGSAARILRVLRAGGVLGVPMDLRSRVASIDVPFLGAPAPTAVGPARIALRTGAPVVVGTCARGNAITMTRIPTWDLAPGEEGERTLTTRINDALSARILALPEAWVWMHARYDP
jgi:KDO2-lipid IV(A) lauroyltransferase